MTKNLASSFLREDAIFFMGHGNLIIKYLNELK